MWSATQPFTGERSCTSALPFLIREEHTEAKPPAQATFKKNTSNREILSDMIPTQHVYP